MTRWLAGIPISLLLACGTPGLVDHTEPAGTITRSVGVPTLLRDTLSYVLDRQSRFYPGDILQTDAHSLIEAELASSSRMTLSPRSKVHIEESTTDGSGWRNRFNLTSGALELTDGALPESLEISTGIAMITTTDASLWVGYSSGYRRIDIVSLGESEIVVRNRDGETRLTARMQATSVSPGAAPQAKTMWSATRLESIRTRYNRTEQ